MPPSPHGATLTSALAPGLAAGVGSLPHRDADAAATLMLQVNPELPAAPELPNLDPRAAMVPAAAAVLPEARVADDGTIAVNHEAMVEPLQVSFDGDAHAGLRALLDLLAQAESPVRRIKVQTCGPLTLGVALHRAGLPADRAFRRAADAARATAVALEERVQRALPDVAMLLVLDEPALVLWRRHDAPIERETAVDLLSGALAAPGCPTGVHVCGDGDVRLAFEAGPTVLGLPVSEALVDDADVLLRHLDADGWIAWGAVPTDRPLGESPEPLWRRLVAVWCELARRGADPMRLRTHALVTPACGLAGHGPTQAERALRLARAIGQRIGDQAVAARLTVGA